MLTLVCGLALSRGLPPQARLLFNVLSLAPVDLDPVVDPPAESRCRGLAVRAFGPEWIRSANQDKGKPARKTAVRRCEAPYTAPATRGRAPLSAGVTLPSPGEAPATELAARAKAAWARLIRKVYEADPLECPKCKGPMRVIALIEDPGVIRRILEHLGLWAPLPTERSPPVDPPPGSRHRLNCRTEKAPRRKPL